MMALESFIMSAMAPEFSSFMIALESLSDDPSLKSGKYVVSIMFSNDLGLSSHCSCIGTLLCSSSPYNFDFSSLICKS
ncbi:hypothetical protein Hanom_Chr15g01359381 [Helianthus anomalus]